MRRLVLLLAMTAAAVPAAGDGLPDRIDFREKPAFVVLGPSEALAARVDVRISGCPGRKEYERLQAPWLALAAEQNRIGAGIHATISEPPGKAHAQIFREKAKQNPEWADLEGKIAAIKATRDARLEESASCARLAREETFEEVTVFEDRELTRASATIRFFTAADPRVRLHPHGEWQRFEGTFIPAGETSYVYETVLERDGDKLLLPRGPFPHPVWLLGGTREVRFAFPQKGDEPIAYFLRTGPDSWEEVEAHFIDGDTAILRGKDDEKPTAQPVRSLFDANGHLRLVIPGC